MAQSRSFTIFLLKKGKYAKISMKQGHGLSGNFAAKNLPDDSSLFVLDNSLYTPWWVKYFGISESVTQVSKGALVFIPVKDRCFVLSFGYAYHKLDEDAYEHDFGIRVTLNCVDPNKLKNTDTVEPGYARRRRTQVPVDSDLTYFDVDQDNAILTTLTGKTKEKYKNLFVHATGASSLRINSSESSKKLPELCEKLLELYNSDEYKSTFPGIQDITPIRDPSIIRELHQELLNSIRNRDEKLNLTIPDIVDYGDNTLVAFTGCGKHEPYDDVSMEHYYSYLETKNQNAEELELGDIKKHKLTLVDNDGKQRGLDYSIMKCLVFDTSLPKRDGVYHLMEGNWYKIEEDYVNELTNFLDPHWEALTLPKRTEATEGEYNKSVAAKLKKHLCLDGESVSPQKRYPVEPCDIYTAQNDVGLFYHIKVSTRSYALSHLFNQGINAIILVKFDKAAEKNMRNLISKHAATKSEISELSSPLDSKNYKIIFGIITKKRAANKSSNLPLFSRISLRRAIRDAAQMSVEIKYGYIEEGKP